MSLRPRLRLPLFLALAASLVLGSAPQAPAMAAAPTTGSAASLGEALGPSSPSQIALAEYLRSKGAFFYGAFWCQHCYHQKLLFGQQAGNLLPYVECAKDEAGERLCKAAGVEAYPTWVLGKERLVGVQTLKELATWSGYTGPTDFPTSRTGN